MTSHTVVTDAELEITRSALLAEEQTLAAEHERLHSTPDDILAHEAHRKNLKAHIDRIHDYRLRLGRR